jgi:hypothetical protein
MKDRAMPGAFTRFNALGQRDPDGQSAKNQLGLHDLSARLLDPRFDIGKQGFELDKTKHAVFMPVPTEEDHMMFYILNFLSKQDFLMKPHLPFVQEVQYIRARMTRIKLAEKTDMGAGFVVMENPITGRTSIRYGLTGKVTQEEEEGAKKQSTKPASNLSLAEQLALKSQNLRKTEGTKIEPGPPLTPEQVQSRIRTALNYKTVLRTAEQLGTNEISIAYRKCASPLFPLITTWPDKDKGDGTYRVTHGPLTGWTLHDNGTITA